MVKVVGIILVLALLLPLVAALALETIQPEPEKTTEQIHTEEILKWIAIVVVVGWLAIFVLLLLTGNHEAAFEWLLVGFRILALAAMKGSSSSSSSKSTGGGKSGGGGSSSRW